MHALPGGFGATATLTQGVDFKCIDDPANDEGMCFAIGAANHRLFQELQQNLNQFSTVTGVPPITVDGFIGNRTVGAVAGIARLQIPIGAFADQVLSLAETRAAIAANARTILAALTQAQAGRPSTTITVTAVETSKRTVYILGGLAAVLLVGGIGIAAYRRKTR